MPKVQVMVNKLITQQSLRKQLTSTELVLLV